MRANVRFAAIAIYGVWVATVMGGSATAQTYPEAIRRALDHSYGLSIQSERVLQADEATSQVRSIIRPQTSFTANGTAGVRGGGDGFETSNVRLGLTQRLFDFSNTRSKIFGRSHVKDAEAWRYEQSRIDRIILASQIYIDMLAIQNAIRLRTDSVAILERQKRGAELKYEIGDGTRTDVGFANARLASTQAGLRREQQRLTTTEAQFRRIFGYQPDQIIPFEPDANQIPVTLRQCLDAAFSASPALKSRDAEFEASEAFLQAARTEYHPKLDARVGLSMDVTDLGGRVSSFTTEAAEVLLTLRVPITTGGQRSSNMAVARSDRRIAALTQSQVRDDIERNVRIVWNDYQSSRDLLKLVEEGVEAAELALQGAIKERDAGFRSALDVLDAEQQLLNSQLSRVDAEAATSIATIRMLTLIGKADILLDDGRL